MVLEKYIEILVTSYKKNVLVYVYIYIYIFVVALKKNISWVILGIKKTTKLPSVSFQRNGEMGEMTLHSWKKF